MPRVKVNDIKLNYEIEGTGNPFVLIHGLGANLKMWFRQIPTFSKHYKTIVYDSRGHGDTEKPKEEYSLKTLIDDLKGLLDKLGIEKAHILGLSMGAVIAQLFTINHPNRVKTLILAAVTPASAIPEGRTPATAAVGRIFTEAMKIPENFDVKEFMITLASYAFSEGMNEELMNSLVGVMEEMIDEESIIMALNAMSNFDFRDQLPKINVPTLIINGDQDMLTPLSGAELAHRLIPHSKLVVIKGGSHCAFLEKAEEFNAAVLRFIKEHGESKG